MRTRRFAWMATLFFTLLLCMLNLITAKAQSAGTGVDPNVVMLDDFENGSTSRWTPRPGARGEKMSFELMNAANGDLVRFGNYALKVNIDFTDAQVNQTLTAQISPGTSGAALQIPGNASGGKKLGMWVYATPGVQGMWFRIATRPIGATSGTTPTDLSSAINWTGWRYVQCNLPAGHEFHPDGIRLLTLKGYANYFANGYIIVDNIRVTNQSFSEDLIPPAIISLTGNGTNLTGAFTTSQIDLSAEFNDTSTPSSGINYNSIHMTVDGYVFKTGDAGFTVNQETNTVSLKGMNLSNGTHNVVVHVEDNFGHITTKTGTFTVEASDGKTTAVTAASAAQAQVGNPFEIKINTNNSKDVKELELVLELNNIGSVDAVNGVTFASSAQAGSSYNFNPRNGYLTISLKNDITTDAVETLATIKVNISKNSNPTDVLRCSPVSAKAVYADNALSLFTLFKAFTRNVSATYDFTVNKRIVGIPGEVLVTDLNGSPLSGAMVYALNAAMTEVVASAVTGADGVASGMNFTNTAQDINIYAEKEGKFTYTKLIRTLNPLLTNVPSFVRSGTTLDPKTSKTITWVTNPIQSAEPAIMKLAKQSEGEGSFKEYTGTTKILEYNALVSNGVAKGNSVTVNNLEPGTTYLYQVGDGITWSPTMEFTTTTDTKKFSFSAFGDLQAASNEGMNRFIAAAKNIEAMPVKPLFNLNVGDIVDTDDRYDYSSYYGYMFNQCPGFAGIDMISAYGNHEYMGNADADNSKFVNGHHRVVPSANYDAQLVGTGTYATEYGNMLVISLDWAHKGGASVNAILTEQAKWLEDILSKTDKTWKIVTMHYPLFPYESTPGSQSILAPVLDKYNVQLMLCGHGHTFERVQVYNGNYLVPATDKRTFNPVIGGTLYFQLGDMTSTGQSGRWINCEVDGKKMTVTSRDASNNVVANECFTLYASPLSEYAVTFNTVNENGTLTATVDGTEITSGKQITEGKNIVFKATPSNGFKVKEWKLNDTVVNGIDSVSYTLSDLSAAATVTVEFDKATGIEDLFVPNLNIYPNPFEQMLHITGAENCTLRVMDVAGAVVHIQKITGADEIIPLKQLLPGVYFFRVEKDGQTKTIKVIKK